LAGGRPRSRPGSKNWRSAGKPGVEDMLLALEADTAAYFVSTAPSQEHRSARTQAGTEGRAGKESRGF